MSEITTIGLDLAKHVFQVHGIDAEGTTVLRKRLRRGQVLAFFSRIPRCVVGLEACATAHYWARELGALGHEVRLMPAQYVKAYIKRNKHDAADAEAICEAVQRPTMRFVPVKTAEQQANQLLHRGREQLVRQRTMLVNALRAHLAEFGMVAAQGLRNVGELIAIVRDDGDTRLPDVARQVLQVLADQIEQIETAVAGLERQLLAWHKTNPVSQRLASIPGIGPIIATAAKWTGSMPTGPGKWNGTNPILPQMATWKTWVLASASEFRSPPPLAHDSPEKAAELAELKTFQRTPKTNAAANFWEYAAGGLRAHHYWSGQIGRLILEYRLDDNPPLAARAYALPNTTSQDAGTACWDSKYAYWAIRPFQLDPDVKPLFSTPNHPSYPAAHGCLSTATAAILGYLFPRDAATLAALAQEANGARIWAGIHYRSDTVAGAALGRAVANKVIEWARKDSSQ